MRPRSLARLLPFAGLLAAVAGADVRAQKVPDIALGPGAWTAATAVAAPIAQVTVFSDRARVRRRGRLAARAGINIVRLPDLAGAAFTDTVRLSAGGARVLRVETTPIERDRLDIAQAAKLLDELDAVGDRLGELDDRTALDDEEIELLGRLRPALPVAEEKREGRKALSVDIGSWGRTLDYLTARTTAARDRLVALADQRLQLVARRDRLRADLRLLDQGGFADRTLAVLGVVEAPADGAIELELEYVVPGARWKPTYDLHFSPARGQLRLETAAAVEQATGEDWEQAALAFSTAIPGRGIDLPELLTWSLGERGDFVPQPRPKPHPRAGVPVPPSVPSLAPAAPGLSGARSELATAVRQRLNAALMTEGAGAAAEGEAAVSVPEARLHRAQGGQLNKRVASDRPSVAEPPAAAPAPSALYEAESFPMAAESSGPRRRSQTQSFSVAASRPTLTPLALQEAPPRTAAAMFNDPLLPAVIAGGLDYVYQAAAPASVPSSGKPIRIPLDARTFRTAAFYQAAPALAATAFLRARVRNDGQRPLLRGSAAIFTDGEFVGQGEIQTTGPGGDIEFPLGADQDIRLVRQVVPRTQTTGIVHKTDQTDYEVEIQIGNYKKQPIAIDVTDQIPRSAQEKVEVKLIGSTPAAQGPPDADGVLRWRVDLPPGATRTIKLQYQITRPTGWMLFQR